MPKKAGDRSDLLTKQEMHKLLSVVAGDLYFTTFYNTLLHTGRRLGEIYGTKRGKELTGGIQVKNIDFENRTLKTYILKTKKRKLSVECSSCKAKINYKNKYCPKCGTVLPSIDPNQLKYEAREEKIILLPEIIINLLKKYTKDKKQNDYLFREISLSWIEKAVKKHAKECGIEKNFTIHGFRHYFITQCKRKGMSNEKIALWTGHHDPSTINIYNRMAPQEVEKEIMEVDL